LKGVLPIVKVDCTVEQGLCSKYGVQGYPTIKLFKNKKPVDYNGGRDAKSLVSFATSNIKSSVVSITSEDGLEKFLAKTPSLPHLILFSEKSPSTLYQALSMRFEGKEI
jgi:thioredoxin-like negative regulator of GroEL